REKSDGTRKCDAVEPRRKLASFRAASLDEFGDAADGIAADRPRLAFTVQPRLAARLDDELLARRAAREGRRRCGAIDEERERFAAMRSKKLPRRGTGEFVR